MREETPSPGEEDQLPLDVTFLKRRLLKGGVWGFAGKVGTGFALLAINAVLARLLSPEEMGVYFILYSLVWLLATTAEFGMGHGSVRFIAEALGMERRGRAAVAVRRSLLVALTGGVVVGIVWALAAGPVVARRIMDSPTMAGVVVLTGGWVFALTIQSVLAEIFRGFHDIRKSAIYGGLATSLLILAGLLAAWALDVAVDLSFAILLIIGAIILNLAVGLQRLHAEPGVSLLAANPSAATAERAGERARDDSSLEDGFSLRKMMAVAWPIWISTILLHVSKQADLWVLGALAGESDAALYGGAARLAEVIFVPLLVVNAVVPPIIAEWFTAGRDDELETALQTTATAAAVPAALALAAFVLAGPFVLGIAYGNFYRQASTVLAILAAGQFFSSWTGTCGLTLIMTGHELVMMAITVVSSTYLIGGAMVVARAHGAVGVALVAASAKVLQDFLYLVFARRKTGMWTFARPSLVPRMTRQALALARAVRRT